MIEELLIRSLCDPMPAPSVDGLFLFGQTADNQHAVFRTARRLHREGTINKVLCLGAPALSGYPGFAAWQEALQQTGFPADAIEAVPPHPANPELLHTLIEATSLARHAKQKGYTRLFVTASPFQQPRAFMTAVTAALREYPNLYLYSIPGEPQPWQEEVTHSQGEVTGTRANLIAGEMKRIKEYHRQGDLASVGDVLDYLNRRDRNQL